MATMEDISLSFRPPKSICVSQSGRLGCASGATCETKFSKPEKITSTTSEQVRRQVDQAERVEHDGRFVGRKRGMDEMERHAARP